MSKRLLCAYCRRPRWIPTRFAPFCTASCQRAGHGLERTRDVPRNCICHYDWIDEARVWIRTLYNAGCPWHAPRVAEEDSAAALADTLATIAKEGWSL